MITRQQRRHSEYLWILDSCKCDDCMGACNSGRGGECGECFACEEIKDNEIFWQANHSEFFGVELESE